MAKSAKVTPGRWLSPRAGSSGLLLILAIESKAGEEIWIFPAAASVPERVPRGTQRRRRMLAAKYRTVQEPHEFGRSPIVASPQAYQNSGASCIEEGAAQID